ncbi:hypothetical protein ColTof4_01242 [Colletotrichum tofieldiae]|nr:hypothetical protein ColTof3_08478 [Colletotrichum tofieldiae]GKT68819.1 hypothetical protein ColTof4_01242 [Colletotrichum tofieldiae]GKT88593.1 hypothetical protein Ct61P_06443 [Colletotrichum tofieldiae]
MPGEEKDGHSSGEYSGVVEEANVAVSVAASGKGSEVATVISSGQSAQNKRRENREKKAREEREATENKG